MPQNAMTMKYRIRMQLSRRSGPSMTSLDLCTRVRCTATYILAMMQNPTLITLFGYFVRS